MPVVIDSSTGTTTQYDALPAAPIIPGLSSAPADDMPTVTVRARFPWYGWLAAGFVAGWLAAQLHRRLR